MSCDPEEEVAVDPLNDGLTEGGDEECFGEDLGDELQGAELDDPPSIYAAFDGFGGDTDDGDGRYACPMA